MAYKSILTVATSPEGLAASITAASLVALAEDAHLDVLALGVDRTQIGYSYVGAGAVIIAAEMGRAEADARATEKAVNAAFAAQLPGVRVAVETAVTQLGMLTEIVASRARYADLVVLPRPYGKGRGAEDAAVLEAALFDGMAPVLVVPERGLPSADPRRVVLAWNQSREAMVAARCALPFLIRADMVSVVVIDPPTYGPERSDPGGLLCRLLVRHGVKAEVSVLAKTLPRVSEVLARHVRDVNADLLVMGAYGHSRLREAILGGATRDMLEAAAVPVLLAH